MSRPLVLLALAFLALAGLAPLVVMGVRLWDAPAALDVIARPRTQDLLLRTLRLGAGAAGMAALVGAPFGYLVSRTDVPGAALWRPLGLVPFLLPTLILAMVGCTLVELRGAPMTILVMGISSAPLVALFTARQAERMDGRRVEAALLAGGLRAALRLELPRLLPAVAAGAGFAFVFAIHDFAVPDYVSSKGPKFNVFADEVFAVWQVDQRAPETVATALPLVLVTLLALLPSLFLARRGATTVDPGFRRPTPLRLGAWRWPALLWCLALVGVGGFLPLGRMLYEAGGAADWSLQHLRDAFALALELARSDLVRSTLFAALAATLTLPVALVLGHLAERARGGRAVVPLVVLPISVPAILYGIGTIVLWNQRGVRLPDGRDLFETFYASGGLVVLMLAGRFLAFPTLVCQGGVAALDPRLEETAELAGARPATRLRRVVAPSLFPSMVGSWTLVFVLCMRELDAAVVVPAAKSTAMYRLFNAVHFGRSDYVAALALMTIFLVVLPGLLWTLFAQRRMEVLP